MNYVEILEDLISIDTTVPPGNNYKRVIDYLEPLFKEAGFKTEKVEIPPEHADGREGRVNLICHRNIQGKPRLIFYAHIDVVPAQGWDAFHPMLKDGRIYGRGAADMKGAIPALLLAMKACEKKELNYNVSVMITTDEETNQAAQLRYIAKNLQPLSGSYIFCLDSSFGFVSIAGLGALQMKIRVKGKSVHSAMSHTGENAVEKAVSLLNALLKLKSDITKRKSKIPACPDTGLTHMEARFNINMIQGGLKVNIVPDECFISLDRRLIPEETVEDARKEIIDTLSTVSDVQCEVVEDLFIPSGPPCEDTVVDKLSSIIKDVTGKGGKYGEMGSGDLSYIVSNEWKGVEFGLGVIRPDCNIHGNNEFVYQKDIEDLSEIIARFITS